MCAHELNLSSLYVGDDSAAKNNHEKNFLVLIWSAMLAVTAKKRGHRKSTSQDRRIKNRKRAPIKKNRKPKENRKSTKKEGSLEVDQDRRIKNRKRTNQKK
jgi:hypothetical protein